MRMIHKPSRSRRRPRTRRGSVIVVVIWAVALGAIIAGTIQVSAFRQANLGVQALARVHARWAARAGVEQMIAVLGYYNEFPDPDDAYGIYEEMGDRAYSEPGELLNASWAIEHYYDGQVFAGPMDEHSKFNINLTGENRDALANLYIDEDIIDAIVDWVDEDEQATLQGAEAAQYLSAGLRYIPRNGFMRNIAELELVFGVRPEDVRGEDWNLNNRFDANEDDRGTLWPYDNADNYLDAGWSRNLTAHSVDGGLSPTGQPRIYLPEATSDELVERLKVSADQADALIAFGGNPDNSLSMLWTSPLSHIRDDGTVAPLVGEDGGAVRDVLPLDFEGYQAVFGELTMDDPTFRLPGKININTASEEVLRDILGFDPAIADAIIVQRQRAGGFTSLVQLSGAGRIFTAPDLVDISEVLDVRSNVFTITSVGRSETTGLEVQLIVVVDRSTLPIMILEYREQ